MTVASIHGGKVPVDPRSTPPTGPEAPVVERFLADPDAARAMSHAVPLEALDATRFDAVFLPGGHGTMFDFPVSTALASALSRAWRAGRIVAAVCHGPAGLVGAVDSDGRPVVAGRRVSAFTNAEEEAVGLTKAMPSPPGQARLARSDGGDRAELPALRHRRRSPDYRSEPRLRPEDRRADAPGDCQRPRAGLTGTRRRRRRAPASIRVRRGGGGRGDRGRPGPDLRPGRPGAARCSHRSPPHRAAPSPSAPQWRCCTPG